MFDADVFFSSFGHNCFECQTDGAFTTTSADLTCWIRNEVSHQGSLTEGDVSVQLTSLYQLI
jgi:hypothetical protein